MKQKIKHYEYVNIEVTLTEPNRKVRIFSGWGNNQWTIAEFFIPAITKPCSKQEAEIIASRAKHDFGITYTSNTYTMRTE